MKLPSWAGTIRPQQVLAVQQVLEAFQSGEKVVILDAPTGTGKTLIADMVRQEISRRSVYLCSSISLQEQFLRDFPEAAVIKGRSNYPTLDYPDRFAHRNPSLSLTCADCNKHKTVDDLWKCYWCSEVSSCPYEMAKSTALRSPFVCANSSYYCYETNYVGTLRGRDLVIVDEADTLEQVLMGFIQVHITPKQIKDYHLPTPEKKTVVSTWLPWAEESYAILKDIQSKRAGSLFENLAEIKEQKRIANLLSSFSRLLDNDTGISDGNWVYDGYKNDSIIFKPITVAPYAEDYFFRHGERFLLMSATIISDKEICRSLGIR